jgi:hypothetical protein
MDPPFIFYEKPFANLKVTFETYYCGYEYPDKSACGYERDKNKERCSKHYCEYHKQGKDKCAKLEQCNPNMPCRWNSYRPPIKCSFIKRSSRNSRSAICCDISSCDMHSKCIDCNTKKKVEFMRSARCEKCCKNCKVIKTDNNTDNTIKLCRSHRVAYIQCTHESKQYVHRWYDKLSDYRSYRMLVRCTRYYIKNDKNDTGCCENHRCTIHNLPISKCGTLINRCYKTFICKYISKDPIKCGINISACEMHNKCVGCGRLKASYDMRRKYCNECCIKCKKLNMKSIVKGKLCKRHK